jgi:hypothetical protein
MKFKPNTIGIYTGIFISFCHLVWSLMVASKLAQGWLDFIFGLHFVNNPFKVNAFNMGTAAALVVFTFAVGYVVGWLSTWAWNKMQK